MTIPYDPTVYTPGPSIQQSFLDKISGTLLAGGLIYFYKDSSRSTTNPVYYIDPSSTYPSYNLIQFPQPMVLSDIGTIVSPSGAAVIPYYQFFNADGTPNNYYIVVQDANGGAEFTIPNFPGVGSTPATVITPEDNYVVNGQFLIHTTPPSTATQAIGYLSQTVTNVAAGGWYFVQDGTLGSRFITFSRIGGSPNIPASFPRYWMNIVQTSSATGYARDDIEIRFPNVNTFATNSTIPNSGVYTLSFTAYSLSGSISAVPYIYEFYGTGGTPTSPAYHPSSSVTITTTETVFYVDLTFPNNSAATIGNNDDDYVSVGLRLPIIGSYDIFITDVFLVQGTTSTALYPVTTEQQDAWRSYGGGMPIAETNTDVTTTTLGAGINLYLPIIYTQNGFDFDTSIIGTFQLVSYYSNPSNTNKLICDGTSYDVQGYSSLGIPYSRLANALWNSSISSYDYGTGYYFATSYSILSAYLLLTNNTGGSVTATTDSGSTGFSFSTITSGVSPYKLFSALTNSTTGLFQTYYAGTGGTAWAWTGGTHTAVTNDNRNNNSSSATIQDTYLVPFTAGSTFTSSSSGDKLQCYTYLSNGSVQSFYLWYNVSGGNTDPTGTGTSIQVNITAADTAATVAAKSIGAFNQKQSTLVGFNNASSSLNNKYWQFYTANGSSPQLWVVWYNVDAAGTQPSVGGANYIQVSVASTDLAAVVATKTITAINKRMVGVPDSRGMSMRIYDSGNAVDPNNASRVNWGNPFVYGNYIGSFEIDNILTHNHSVTNLLYAHSAGQDFTNAGGVNINTGAINFTGINENVVKNIELNLAIIY